MKEAMNRYGWIAAVALTLASSQSAVASSSAEDELWSRCSDAWYDSKAKAWCYITDQDVALTNTCHLTANCDNKSGGRVEKDYSGTPGWVETLDNCFGHLQPHGC